MIMGTARIEPEVPGWVSRKPESKPLMETSVSCAGIQGLSKVDSVAVWFPVATAEADQRMTTNMR
jgi:hypothetical protein